jgi:3-oxoacyl-[acyl-carrier-protein] synthase III
MAIARHRVKIASLGSYLPPHVVSTADLESRWGTPKGRIQRVTGVEERRYETAKTSAEMAATAARAALTNAGIALSDIDMLIGASAIPQQVLPCMAALIQLELGSTEGAYCLDIDATCLSFVTALHLSTLLICSGEAERILICSSEKASQSLNPKQWESAGLFGDAAAAVVLTRTPAGESSCVEGSRFETYASGAHLTTALGGGTLHHPNDPETQHEHNLFNMDGPGVLRMAAERYGPFLARFLEDSGRKPSDYDFVVPHQASRSGLQLLTARYGFREEQIVRNLSHRGNCVAASIPLAFAEAVESGLIHRGHRILLTGTAAGLSLGILELVF